MTAIVTGASGHVGANLVRTLLARGRRVRALIHNRARALDGLDLERLEGDVTDLESVRRLCEGASVIFHLAALISIDGPRGGEVERVNVQGTRNVAQVAHERGVRMVHCCSVHAFCQSPLGQPLDETRARVAWQDRRHPAYDQSKAEGERVVRALVAEGLDAVLLHPTGIIGPHDYELSRMGHVFTKLYHRTLPGIVAGGFNWVDVRDVVGALLACEDPARALRNESYLLSGHWRSIAEVAATAHAITGVKPPRLSSPMWLARASAPFMTAWARLTKTEPLYTNESLQALRANRVIVSDKAKRAFGFEARPFAQSVYDVYAWHRDAGNIAKDATLTPPDDTGDAAQ